MKCKWIIAALLGGVVGVSHAQSSVTLYGIINQALTYSSNQGGHSAVQLTNNGIYGSRWGLKGSEDLGGGLRAIFTLENGFTANTGALGQNNRMFGRTAFVGLSDARYGTVTAGRQYDAIVGTIQTMTSNGAWGGVMMSHPYDNDNTDDYLRVNNSVKYVSPTVYGFQGTAMYGFSNDAGAFANNRMWSAGGIWTSGPFAVAAAYSLYDSPGVNTTATVNTNGAITCCDAPITSKRETIAGAGVSYKLGVEKFNLLYTNAVYNNVGTSLASGVSYRFNNYEASSYIAVTPAAALGFGYTYTSDAITGGASPTTVHWHQVNLFGSYALSKATFFYSELIYLRAIGGAFSSPTGSPLPSLAGGGGLASQIQTMSASTSKNQTVFTVGLVHKF